MTSIDRARVLVTGATGMQGGAVVQSLLQSGHEVTAFVRDPSSGKARALVGQGVTLAAGTMDDIASLEAASAGHDAVFSMQVTSAEPGAEVRHATNIVTAARRAGVTQVIHTSVSGTGWRSRHPDVQDIHPAMTTYWDWKEGAEDAVRRAGLHRWTIVKPALYMDNFLPDRKDYVFPDFSRGELSTAASPEAVIALICAADLGAAVAAAVADPDAFHEAEIEMAGDALTHTQMAATLSAATGRQITAVFSSRQEQEQRIGAPATDSQVWHDRVGYPARPHHAAQYGLTTTPLDRWAAQQNWNRPTA